MNVRRNIVPCLLALFAVRGASSSPEPLACRLNALTPSQRDRHQALAEELRRAVVERAELPDGYALTLDLGRLPADAHGLPFCVVEVAEWVDLESRCCPFLNFGLDVRGKGGTVKLRLTGPDNVKPFLEEELGLKRVGGR